MIAAKCSRKKPSHSRHSASVPLQDVLEIARQHGLTLAMGEAIGVQRYRRPGHDRKQSEGGPGRKQRPGRSARGHPAREYVDNATEQHGLGKLRRRQEQVCASEDPAELRLFSEQLEDADVEADERHTKTLATHHAGWAFATF